MTERDLNSNIDLGMSSDDTKEKVDPKMMPELREKYNNFELIEQRTKSENYEAELEAQALGFIRQAMKMEHPEPNYHTEQVDEEKMKKLNGAETLDEFKTAISQAYSDPAHMIEHAAYYFEENFPGNGRNGDGLDSLFEATGHSKKDLNGTFGAEMVNIRTRARKILGQLKEDFDVKTREPVAVGS